MNKLRLFALLVCALLAATALSGILWQQESLVKTAIAFDGRQVELFGRGAYANHSLIRATSYLGADWAMLVFVIPLLLLSSAYILKDPRSLFLCSGGFMIAFYYSISQAFGAAFNQFFLLYTVLFSVTGYSFGYSLSLLAKSTWKRNSTLQRKNRATAIFLFLAGASALIWLTMIIPAMITMDYSEFLDINTTEPTFAMDIGVIFPLFTICGIALLKESEFGLRMTPVLLTFFSLVGFLVVSQTIVQHIYGIQIPLPQMISLVASFIVLGVAALLFNIYFMKRNFPISIG
jgi:hypothetical protein